MNSDRPPIIDVHCHAFSTIPDSPPFDPPDRLPKPKSYDEYKEKCLRYFKEYNMTAVPSGAAVQDWYQTAPDIIIPGIETISRPEEMPVETLRKLYEEGKFRVMTELIFQYSGIAPNDPEYDPYFALADELDVPVILHIGIVPPGAAYIGYPDHRASLARPLLLEDVLVKYPDVRFSVAHAGWPMLDEMIALLYHHPQVYCDISVLNWAIPRNEFHLYLRRLVEAGFGRRVMYGSDQMFWPDAIPLSIEGVESADYLSEEQKRDIFYNNAKRFLRL
jgi:predicted TIM-barrel fold metal-dependent hydrolase